MSDQPQLNTDRFDALMSDVLERSATPEQVELGTGGPPNVENMYTPKDFTEIFGQCEVLVCEEYHAEQRSGSAHYGMSALIDFIARKPL